MKGNDLRFHWKKTLLTTDRSLTVPNPSICTLHPLSSSLLCASDTAYFLDPDSGLWRSFSASMNPVHRIISSSSVPDNISSFLTTAENDRSIRVFSLGSDNSVGTLRTEDEITSMALHSTDDMVPNSSGKADGKNDGRPQQTLLAVNKGGTLELFASPFTFDGSSVQSETETLKSRMKKRTRKASALIKVIRPGKTRPIVPIVDASFSGNDVVLVWTEGGVNLVFDRFQWRDEGNGKLLVDGVREIVKPKSGPAIGGAVMNGVKDMGKGYVDESNTTVIHGGDKIDEESAGEEQKAISISSDEEDSDAGEAVEGDDASEGPEGNSVPNNVTAVDLEMQDAESYDEGDRREDTRTAQTARDDDDPIATEGVREQNELEEPSFGDLLRASTSEPIDVQNIDQGPPEQSLAPITERGLGIPSGMSLGNVLAQSLRTNDVPLLESCFHVRDLTTVRATIERLDSSLATVMLQKLAERLHSRPGRAGSLMVWIQWTLVAHGGYLASQPALMKKLASLYRVVRERADSLESLLSLKGKLDMLEAQMNLRKSMQLRSKALAAADEDDEVVIYVEGQEESDSEIEDAEDSSPQNLLNKTDLPTNDDITQAIGGRSHGEDEDMDDAEEEQEDDEDDGDDDDDDGGGSTDANEEEIDDTRTAQSAGSDSASENDLDNVIDDEASSTSADSDDEISPNDIDHESIDPSESLVSSEPEAPPAKRPAKPRLPNGTSSRRR